MCFSKCPKAYESWKGSRFSNKTSNQIRSQISHDFNDAPQISARIHPLAQLPRHAPPTRFPHRQSGCCWRQDQWWSCRRAGHRSEMYQMTSGKTATEGIPPALEDRFEARNNLRNLFFYQRSYGVSSTRGICQTGSNLRRLDPRVIRWMLCLHFFQVLADAVCINQTIIHLDFSCNQIGDEEVRWVGSCARVDGIEKQIWGTKRCVFFYQWSLINQSKRHKSSQIPHWKQLVMLGHLVYKFVRITSWWIWCVHVSPASHARVYNSDQVSNIVAQHYICQMFKALPKHRTIDYLI